LHHRAGFCRNDVAKQTECARKIVPDEIVDRAIRVAAALRTRDGIRDISYDDF